MITGLSAFPITPTDEAGRVDTDGLQMLLARLVAAEVDTIGLLGSTGSYPYLTRAERQRAVRAAVECVGDRMPLLVGVGALRTDEAVALTREAMDAGASMGLLAPVSYAPLLDDEVFEHVRAVAAVGLPICLYNNPGTTHFTFTPGLIERLAVVPNVVAVKNPAPPPAECAAMLQGLRSRVPAGFSVGVSVDINAAASVLAGADAWYSVLAGIYPAICRRLDRAARAGNVEAVRQITEQLQPIWTLYGQYTSYRIVHLAATMAGVPNARPSRPVLPLAGEAAAAVQAVLERCALT